MTVDSQPPNGAAKPPPDPHLADDESTIATPPKGNKTIRNNQGMTSKVLKFRFSPTQQKQQVPPSIIHTHWMHAVQEAFGEEVEIINNRNQKVESINLIHWSNPLTHKKQFKTYQKTTGRDQRRKTTYYILHRIQTNESLKTIRNIPQVQKILRDNNCYVTEHHWTETDWDTVSIGFVTNIDPGFYNSEQAQARFHKILKDKYNATGALSRTKTKIPKFKMIFSSPSINSGPQQRRVSTKAYAIEVKHEDQILMIQVLKTLLRDTPTFVPYSMRYKYPDGYSKALQFQTHQIRSNRTIVLQHISESAMYYLEDRIKSIEGVKDILPAKDVSLTGRHNILVDKNDFQTVRTLLMIAIAKWHNDFVEVDALPPEGYFPGPPRVKPITDDGISSGENSWMSMSNVSFLSMDLSMVENDDYFVNNQSATKTFTYAEILLPNKETTQTFQSTQMEDDDQKEIFSDITGTRTSTTESMFLRKEIERLQVLKEKELQETRAIIEAQRQELQTLRENHLKEILAQREKFEEVKLQNTIAQEQVDMKLYHIQQQMRLEMARMMEQLMHTNLQPTTTSPTLAINDTSNPSLSMAKRLNEDHEQQDDQTNSTRRDKRPDTKKSPVKQQLTYGDTIQDLHKQPVPSAMEAEDECDITSI